MMNTKINLTSIPPKRLTMMITLPTFKYECLPVLAVSSALLLMTSATAQANAAPEGKIPDHYIVKLQANQRAQDVVPEIARQHGLGLGHVYSHAFNGFSAKIPAARLKVLKEDSRILSVLPDQFVNLVARGGKTKGGKSETPLPAQIIPTGVKRINGDLNSTMAGNGSGSVDADVAVIDTGITANSDLNVVGGVNCLSGSPKNYKDGNGHGTHVAGTIGALDNASGVVGVAPGARLWAVRVLDSNGSGSWSSVICGIDYVASKASTIEVANMSLGGPGNVGSCTDGGMREAICNATSAGVTFVVAAGNDSSDTATQAPAAYPEVITVSALADFDGVPGGLGSPNCRNDVDDSFANFSNFGDEVDIIAPGVCITSTWNDGSLATISGTSMAAPHVAGAAALYKQYYPQAGPEDVKSALINTGSYDWNASDDQDGIQEPLLDIGQF